MNKIDVVCPLYCAESYIENLISALKAQKNIEYGKVIFPLTDTGDTAFVKSEIEKAGYIWFSVNKEEFSHSLTREKAIFDYCESEVVIMLSQDVIITNENAFKILTSAVDSETVYAYGRQVVKKKTIEHYIRNRNYGKESFIVQESDIEKMQLFSFFASDAFSAYHRPTFIKLNGYDNIPMMMNEDMYYAKKILESGYKKAYVAEAVVEHSHKLKLKQLYNRYYQTGKWFAEHTEFNGYKTTDSGFKLAVYVLGQAIIHFNVPVLFRWLPDMTSRYLGMRKGKKFKGR